MNIGGVCRQRYCCTIYGVIQRQCRHIHHDTAFSDRIKKLQQQQINMKKTTLSEQVLGMCNEKQYPLQYTLKELRTAYFLAAKACHPDSHSSRTVPIERPSQSTTSSIITEDGTAEERFILVTNAYEYLRQQLLMLGARNHNNSHEDHDVFINELDEDRYRTACMEWLGQPAEIVEESKRCPNFRQWLFGRTDAAFYWQSFFMLHGGLAPQLRSTTSTQPLLLSDSNNENSSSTAQQQQRPRRRRQQQRPDHR
jgi:hypothetical protein